MGLSRDLHVAVVEALAARVGRPLRIWDALAASGVRGLRACSETRGVELLIATDLQPQAVAVLSENVRRLGLDNALARSADAHVVPPEAPFDLVDLDPYGSPMPFLETALDALRPGGVLGITATDMPVLAGPQRTACERRYGARPLRNYLCREAGLRILLAAVARAAALRGRNVRPLLSYARDHHVRSYLELGPARGDEPLPVGSVPFEGYQGPPLPHGTKGGPLWTGNLHHRDLVRSLEPPRSPSDPEGLRAWMACLKEEAEVDVLFYYSSGEVGKLLHLPRLPPLAAVLAGLRARGWRSGPTPMDNASWRTDAPWSVVKGVVQDLVDGEIAR